MSLVPGQQIAVEIEKAAAGGRMLARHGGQVVLVLGAIPGERVLASVERVEKRLAFARPVEILEPSPDRRPVAGDPLCGGCVYAHVGYTRQLALKSDVIADAFARIGRLPVGERVEVLGSPEHGYRLRARLHVRGGRAGFYREATHQLCDARGTGQLASGAMDAIERALGALQPAGLDVASIELSEDLTGDRRALHVEASRGPADIEDALTRAVAAAGLAGCTAAAAGRRYAAGDPVMSDPLTALTGGRASEGALRRSPESFFQNNRYLLPSLVGAVLDAVPASGPVLDLYAGVGLFSVALAAGGRRALTAVEGDRASGADLRDNARPWRDGLEAVVGSVESHLARCRPGSAATVVLDPPRTGVSTGAMASIVRLRARTLVYVSCDPPTLARDARRLVDGGYRLASLRGFDLFPNTPHVETLGLFELS
jgi:23S rRNA (uracil1939-C5)-methyltransferase